MIHDNIKATKDRQRKLKRLDTFAYLFMAILINPIVSQESQTSVESFSN